MRDAVLAVVMVVPLHAAARLSNHRHPQVRDAVLPVVMVVPLRAAARLFNHRHPHVHVGGAACGSNEMLVSPMLPVCMHAAFPAATTGVGVNLACGAF